MQVFFGKLYGNKQRFPRINFLNIFYCGKYIHTPWLVMPCTVNRICTGHRDGRGRASKKKRQCHTGWSHRPCLPVRFSALLVHKKQYSHAALNKLFTDQIIYVYDGTQNRPACIHIHNLCHKCICMQWKIPQ